MGGDLSGLVQHDLYERGVSNVAKVNDQFGDTIKRMAGMFWILGEADHLFTLAWLSACVETGVHWLSPAAQNVSDTLKEIGHYAATSNKGKLKAEPAAAAIAESAASRRSHFRAMKRLFQPNGGPLMA